MTREDKINFIIRQEKQHGNSWKWIEEADDETVNNLYDYWTQELVAHKTMEIMGDKK